MPQRRALFRHLNCQMWSGVRTWCVLYILPSARATRHSDVYFFDIPTSKSVPTSSILPLLTANLLRATTARNSSSLVWPDGSAPAALTSLLFDPHRHNLLEKRSASRLSYLFAHLHLPLLTLSLHYLLSSALFVRDSSHLCLSICPCCWKFVVQTLFDYSLKSQQNPAKTKGIKGVSFLGRPLSFSRPKPQKHICGARSICTCCI